MSNRAQAQRWRKKKLFFSEGGVARPRTEGSIHAGSFALASSLAGAAGGWLFDGG